MVFFQLSNSRCVAGVVMAHDWWPAAAAAATDCRPQVHPARQLSIIHALPAGPTYSERTPCTQYPRPCMPGDSSPPVSRHGLTMLHRRALAPASFTLLFSLFLTSVIIQFFSIHLLSFVPYTWNYLSHRRPALMVLTFPAAYHNRNVIFFNLVYIALWWLINFFFFFYIHVAYCSINWLLTCTFSFSAIRVKR